MAVFFTYTLRFILKKTKEKPDLYHLSRPFYFHIYEYNRIVLVAFSFILLPTPSEPSFPPNRLYTLVILRGLDAFCGMDYNIFLLYSQYFILFIFKLAF